MFYPGVSIENAFNGITPDFLWSPLRLLHLMEYLPLNQLSLWQRSNNHDDEQTPYFPTDFYFL